MYISLRCASVSASVRLPCTLCMFQLLLLALYCLLFFSKEAVYSYEITILFFRLQFPLFTASLQLLLVVPGDKLRSFVYSFQVLLHAWSSPFLPIHNT